MVDEEQCSPWITFDERFKTFRLRCGDSLYALAISPELSLEHVYWVSITINSFIFSHGYRASGFPMGKIDGVELPPIDEMLWWY